MKELTILIGPSGSGKSTYAHSLFLQNPDNVVIVNRDKIRELLYGYTEIQISNYYLRKDYLQKEKEVTIYEDSIIETALSKDKHVIIDSTNLEESYLSRFSLWNVKTNFKVFDIPKEDCIKNNTLRIRSVGIDVINKQFLKLEKIKAKLPEIKKNFEIINFEQDNTKPNAVIFDIDGTLADHKNKRNPFDFKKVEQDEPVPFVVNTLKAFMNQGYKIIIASGREETCRPETVNWLKQNEIPYHQLYMRAEKDTRPDWIIKQEFWYLIKHSFYILTLFDDRAQVVRRARALGLKVNQVNYGNF